MVRMERYAFVAFYNHQTSKDILATDPTLPLENNVTVLYKSLICPICNKYFMPIGFLTLSLRRESRPSIWYLYHYDSLQIESN